MLLNVWVTVIELRLGVGFKVKRRGSLLLAKASERVFTVMELRLRRGLSGFLVLLWVFYGNSNRILILLLYI